MNLDNEGTMEAIDMVKGGCHGPCRDLVDWCGHTGGGMGTCRPRYDTNNQYLGCSGECEPYCPEGLLGERRCRDGAGWCKTEPNPNYSRVCSVYQTFVCRDKQIDVCICKYEGGTGGNCITTRCNTR